MSLNIIPPMTAPLGRHWRQPNRNDILVDDDYAVISRANFDALPEYSSTTPSGVYAGKMWRRHDGAHDPECRRPTWLLCWYGDSPRPNCCTINHRVLLIA